MKIYNIEEYGFERALRGLARSYNQDLKNMPEVALKLAPKDRGHNKFLRQIMVWMEVEAPRFWWSEFDTYKIGTVAQSDSTMHMLKRQPLEQGNFEYGCNQQYLEILNSLIEGDYNIACLKNQLPEGFIQGRTLSMNYAVLREIILQRWDHKLPQWQTFCREVMLNLKHLEYLGLPLSITVPILEQTSAKGA